MQQRPVDTYVGLRRRFPSQVGVAQRTLAVCRNGVLIARLPPVLTVDAIALKVRVVADTRLVTGLTPTATKFQVVNPIHVLHEFLAGDTPCGADGWEEAPTVTRSELTRTVRTEVGGDQITAIIIIGYTRERGHDGPSRGCGSRASRVNLVRCIQRLNRTVCIMASVDACPGVHRVGVGRTEHHVEVMLVELTVVVQHVIPDGYHVETTGIGSFTALVAAPRSLVRIEERFIINDTQVFGERGCELQRVREIIRTVEFLRVIQREDTLSARQQTMLQRVLVLVALDVLQRVRNIAHTVEIRVVIIRIIYIINRSVRRRVNN